MKFVYIHSSGEFEDGSCFACSLDGFAPEDLKPHCADPDPDGDRDEPYCAVCGHDVDEIVTDEIARARC